MNTIHTLFIRGKLIIASVMLTAFKVQAQGPVQPQTDIVSAGNLVNLISGLFIVLLAFFLIAYVLKKLTGASAMSRGYIRVVDAMHLSAREKIMLVKVAETYMVLGVSHGGISALHVMDGDLPEAELQGNGDFKTRLNDILTVTKLKAG